MNARRYPSRPFSAVGVIVWKDDRLLIIKRAHPPRAGQWGFIGGAVELGETLFEAAAREAQEEATIIVEPFSVITAIDSITRDAAGAPEFHYVISEINTRLASGAPVPSDEVTETAWVTLEQLSAMPVWDEMKRVAALAALQKAQYNKR